MLNILFTSSGQSNPFMLIESYILMNIYLGVEALRLYIRQVIQKGIYLCIYLLTKHLLLEMPS